MGFKRPRPKSKKEKSPCSAGAFSNKTSCSSPLEPLSLEELPYPTKITRKTHQRGLRFNVSLDGVLQISASKSARDSDILSLLESHQPWILQQIKKNSLVKKQFPQKKWLSEQSFPLNGKALELVLSPSSTKKAHIRFMEQSFEYFYPQPWHELSSEDFHEKLHKSFLYFFKLKASEILNEKVSHWSEEMNLFPKSVTYRNQKTRWGSCSSLGDINLNWRLAAFEPEIQNYVIVHELAHLTHQDHSRNFWGLVESFIPNRKLISKKLQENALEADCYAAKSELYKHNPGL